MNKLNTQTVYLLVAIFISSFASAQPEQPEQDQSLTVILKSGDPPKEIKFPPMISDNPDITGLVNVTPIKKNDLIIGYKIIPSERGKPLLSKYGLFSGDVITTINGITISSKESAIAALRKVAKSPSIKLDVLRKGKKVNVSILLE